jgi:pyruvate dehydrogenase E2 component (dihydrolipoamide acetyltransferase)
MKPVVNDRDEIEIGHKMSITLSGDHRVVDGAVAAEYMGALRNRLPCYTIRTDIMV